MDHFHYIDQEYCAEDITVAALAETYDTPLFVYSRATILKHWSAFKDAMADRPHKICYAVKANSNLSVLRLLAEEGAGFDVVSQGELERVVAAGGNPAEVIYSGVGKKTEELERALSLGIYCFNIESKAGLLALNQVAARLSCVAPISLRINPDVDAKSHPYISTGLKENKFGIDSHDALALYDMAATLSNIKIVGIDCHIGSQLTELDPFLEALDRLLVLIDTLAERGIILHHLDLGGDLGVRYQNETPPTPAELVRAIVTRLGDRPLTLILEPGRAIMANAGVLITRVIHLKENQGKHFAIVDAAMNDLLRPALYNAFHDILPAQRTAGTPKTVDVVGPICETGDFLGKDRSLNVAEKDLLVVRSAGAYGFSMSSTYNSRLRAAEVMVSGDKHRLIRRRETYPELFEAELLLVGGISSFTRSQPQQDN